MRQRRFHSITLGCKLNQFDTAAIEGELSRRGYVQAADPSSSGVVVVNTCTVTSKADSEARRIIRRVRRSNPDCRVLVTGCYAERDVGAIEAIPVYEAIEELPNLVEGGWAVVGMHGFRIAFVVALIVTVLEIIGAVYRLIRPRFRSDVSAKDFVLKVD